MSTSLADAIFPPPQTIPPTPSAEELARLNSLAEEVDISRIFIGERVRRDFSHVPALAKSIKENGLIQPIVLDYGYNLIAGESRIRAHKTLGLKTVRAVFRGVLDEAQLHILECEENNTRQGLTWQERCLSVDRVHRYKSTEAVLRGMKWGVRETGDLLKQGKSQIGLVTHIAAELHANNAEVWKAENLSDAWRVLLGQREREALKLLVAGSTAGAAASQKTKASGIPITASGPTLTIPKVDFFAEATQLFESGVTGPEVTDEMPGDASKGPMVVPLSTMYLKETDHNSIKMFESLGVNCCDHIITDPPYAIDMDNLQQSQGGQDVSTVAKEHDPIENGILLRKFIAHSFYAVRDKGFFILWCDPTMWMDLCGQCTLAGFRVQRWPLVWHKTSTCSNQSASTNFTKNIEFAVVARKGNATLLSQQPSCVYTGGSDAETRLLGHPFAKPAGLWEWLFRATCQRGAEVLDPFVGVGSSMLPALRLGLRPRGIECNDLHYGRGLVNLQNFYKSVDPQCTFQ